MIESTPTWREELKGLLAVTTDWKILILTPAFLASNWFYAYQFALNAAYFSLRSRALNSMMYWLFQMFGSFAISGVLDYKGWERRTRGLVGLSWVFPFFFFPMFSLLQSIQSPTCLTLSFCPEAVLIWQIPLLGHWLGLCLGLELRCQYRLHIRHGNMDRRRHLPNYIHSCRCSTLSRLGRSRMGRSIRFVLPYVPLVFLTWS